MKYRVCVSPSTPRTSLSRLHSDEGPTGGGLKQKIRNLDRRYDIFKIAKFALAGVSGFIVSEIILLLGLLTLFVNLNVPSGAYFSPTLLGLNVLAVGVGITVAFFINERITVRVRNDPRRKGAKQLIVRLLKFEAVNGGGSAIGVAVQLFLLRTFSISPALGNVVGAIAGYPIMYLVSMRFVWKTGHRA